MAACALIVAMIFAATSVIAQQPTVTKRQQVFFFKMMFKNKTKVGMLANKDALAAEIQEVDQAAMSYQVWSVVFNVKSPGDLGKGLKDLLNNKNVEAIMLLPDPIVTSADNRKYVIGECMVKHIPVIGDSREAVEAGALYSLEMKDGKVVALVNLKAAASLGVQIPPEIMTDAVVVVPQ